MSQMRSVALSTALGLLLPAPALVHSQSASHEPEFGQLEEIVVTAQRREQRLQDIPISISAFTGENLKSFGVMAARDIAAYTPSLQWKGAFEFASPTIFLRGIGDNSFQANNVSAVGLYFDDVYIASGSGANQLSLDVDRVEVLKGPQGTLYGRNTTGGAINFISHKPVPGSAFSANANATVASYSFYAFDGEVEVPVNDRASARIAATYQTDKGPFRFTELGQRGRNVEAWAARAMLAFNIADNTSLLLNVHGGRTAADAPLKMTGAVDPVTFGPCVQIYVGSHCVDFSGFTGSGNALEDQGNELSRERRIDTYGADARLEWNGEGIRLTAVTGYEGNNRVHHEDLDHSPSDWAQNEWITASHQFSQELRLQSTASDSVVRWITGAYYSREKLQSFQSFALRGFGPGILTGASNLEGVAQDAAQTTDSAALFGEAYWDLAPRWTLTVGARVTFERKKIALDSWVVDVDGTSPATVVDKAYSLLHESVPLITQRDSPNWSKMSGRVVLSYKVQPDVMLYGSISRGFKAGGFNGGALFNQKEAAIVNPEFLTSLEIGGKSEFSDHRVRLNGAAFYYDYSDQQVFVLESAGLGLVQTLSNAGKSSVKGLEAELQMLPTDALLLSTGVSMLDAKFKQFNNGAFDYAGNRLPAAPRFSGNALARYTWHFSGGTQASMQADVVHTGRQFFEATNNPALQQGAHTLANARLEYQLSGGRYKVAAWVKNLTDKRYFTDGFDNAAFGWDVFVVGEPRSFGVTFSANVD